MRIGVSTLIIQGGKTGIAQYLFALLRALSQRSQEHRFTLFVLEEDLALFDFAREHMALVPVPEEYRPPVRNIWWHQCYLPRKAAQLGLDVLHIPSYRRLLGRRPCKLVGTIHDLAPFCLPRKYDWKRMFYGRVVVRWLAHHQDRIIAVSQNTARDLMRFFNLPQRRISVIYNGIDHARFSPGSPELAKAWVAARYGVRGGHFLYLARLEHPGKSHVRLIEAFNQFKSATHSPWRLVFGGSDWHGAEAIHAAIRCSPWRDEIHVLGFA